MAARASSTVSRLGTGIVRPPGVSCVGSSSSGWVPLASTSKGSECPSDASSSTTRGGGGGGPAFTVMPSRTTSPAEQTTEPDRISLRPGVNMSPQSPLSGLHHPRRSRGDPLGASIVRCHQQLPFLLGSRRLGGRPCCGSHPALTKEEAKDVQFPMTTSESDFNGQVSRRLPGVTGSDLDASGDAQPYQPGRAVQCN